MKKRKSHTSIFCLLLAIFLLTAAGSPAEIYSAQKNEERASESEQKQETENTKKLKSRETWEKIISIPGTLIYFPFWLLYSGINPVITFLEKNKLVPKITDFLASDDGRRISYPTFRSRTGMGFRFNYMDLINPGTKLDFTATLGFRWTQFYRLRLQRITLGGQWKMNLGFIHQYLSSERYFGLGNDSLYEDITNFSLRQSIGWISLNYEPEPQLSFGTSLGLEHGFIGTGRNPNNPSTTSLPLEVKEAIPGFLDRITFLSYNFHIELDTRNRIPDTSSGWLSIFKAGIYNQTNNSQYNFVQAAVDIRRHFHLFYDRVLVVRTAGMVTRPLSSSRIPFYMLSELGQRRSIRGFRRGRFRDRDKILGSLEYHFPLNKRPRGKVSFNAYLFVDAGKVAHNLFHSSLGKDYHWGYGGALQIFNKINLDIHIIIGHSRDGFRFALAINDKDKSDINLD